VERPRLIKTENQSRGIGLHSQFIFIFAFERSASPRSVAAYFGDLKDGVHKGDENDPRVSIIEVVPEEIRYWMPTKGTIGRAIETGISAMTGKVAAPGELRTITKAEVRIAFQTCGELILIAVRRYRSS